MRTERDPDGRVLTIIDRLDEIPVFTSEREEADWWASRDFSDELRAQLVARPIPEQLRRLIPAQRQARQVAPKSDPA